MGWHEKRITLVGVRSAHNSLQDRLDQAKWEYLADQIQRLLDRNREDFESLRIEMTGPGDD